MTDKIRLRRRCRVLQGDALERLALLPDGSVNCVVSSPLYWGLRDYQTATWEGGDPKCDHQQEIGGTRNKGRNRAVSGGTFHDSPQIEPALGMPYRDVCGKCGAHRVDSQIGLEESPEEYVAKLVEVFREVRRCLRSDGVMFLNLGDSYNAAGRTGHGTRVDCKQGTNRASATRQDWVRPGSARADGKVDGRSIRNRDGVSAPGLKPKDLVGIPWMVAFALRADGWTLRQDIIWAKGVSGDACRAGWSGNPMPESVIDRCSKAHEYIFLLAKSERYFFDAEAIKEPSGSWHGSRFDDERDLLIRPTTGRGPRNIVGNMSGRGVTRTTEGPNLKTADEKTGMMRNRRDVWTISTQSFEDAHFAVFPSKLIEPCVLAGCPAKVCARCGAPHVRVVEKESVGRKRKDGMGIAPMPSGGAYDGGSAGTTTTTIGWRPTCRCKDRRTRPGTVLDPFGGSGTTGLVALEHGRRAVLIDLSAEYVRMARDRIGRASAQATLPFDLSQMEP
ncbi:MAG: site-specific DNA-methyltransferase [Lentisphaerota bacterium]